MTLASFSGTKSTSGAKSSLPHAASFSSSDSRRGGVSSTLGAPRKNQAARMQHRNRRRHQQTDGNDWDEAYDAMAESRPAVPRKGRRQQTDITHLLNISTPPPNLGRTGRGYIRTTPSWAHGSGRYDKWRFVNANYRFVVSPAGGKGATPKTSVPGSETTTDSPDNHGYYAQATDPDKHAEWADILQVIASAESQSRPCPICLSDMTAAPRMARCGHIFCLACLIRFAHSTDDDNDDSARKEYRAKKCPLCEEHFRMLDTRPVRFYHGMESPLPKPGEDVVLRLMQRDQGLVLALPRDGGGDVGVEDAPWHDGAGVLDYARIMKGSDEYMVEQHDEEIHQLEQQAMADGAMFGADEAEWVQRAIRAVEAAKARIRSNPSPPIIPPSKGKHTNKHTHGYYFYMAPPHMYLSPLDIRILKTAFGDFSEFPPTLLPRVEHISDKTMDEALRRRTRYLSHIPLGCLVYFLECDWAGIVPDEVLAGFALDLEKRRKVHRDKAVQEERERLDAERVAAGGGFVQNHFESVEDVVRDDDFVPLGGGLSFGEDPGLGPLGGESASPSESRTVWGTRAVGDEQHGTVPNARVNDGWLNPDALEDAHLATQLEAVHVEVAGGKKKKKKITLMTTGGRRGQ